MSRFSKPKERVIIFGLGPVAEVAYAYIKHHCDVILRTVDKEYMTETLGDNEFHRIPIIPFEKESLSRHAAKLFIPISYKSCNTIRAEKYLQAKEWGFEFYTYVDPTNKRFCKVGENCMILENVTLQPETTIGNNCIIWSHTHIGHHNVIGDHCYITSGTILCGGTEVGDYTFLGAGSLIRDNITIGKKNIIGMGAVIVKSTNDEEMYIAGIQNKVELTKPIEKVKI